MSKRPAPRLWSDFDGTAVGLVSKTNPRNWSKYPLPALEGYLEFLKGVQDGGVEIAGIVSRRPNILPRRLATTRSIAKLGMDQYFPGSHQVVLTGSEEKKAEFVARESFDSVVGMIDDKPDKFGVALITSLQANSSAAIRQEIVLGAVDQPRRQEYLERLATWAAATDGITFSEEKDGLYIGHPMEQFGVHVVSVEPYSEESGHAFAELLTR